MILWDVLWTLPVPDSTLETSGWQVTTFDELERATTRAWTRAECEALQPPALKPDGSLDAEALGDTWYHQQSLQLSAPQIIELLAYAEARPWTLSNAELDKAYDAEREEFLDSPEELADKVRQVAAALRHARHPVTYTGAGVSTSANIPDFRGPAGVWTLRDKGKMPAGKNLDGATPTFSHYAITELARSGHVRFVVSTNMDALHLRSGLPRHLISEQHGNCHKERCERCFSEYYRQFDTLSTVVSSREHFTGRKCDWCGGRLKDTIVRASHRAAILTVCRLLIEEDFPDSL